MHAPNQHRKCFSAPNALLYTPRPPPLPALVPAARRGRELRWQMWTSHASVLKPSPDPVISFARHHPPVGEAPLRSLCAAMSGKVSFQACIARRFWASAWSSSHLASAVVGCRDPSRACPATRATERVAQARIASRFLAQAEYLIREATDDGRMRNDNHRQSSYVNAMPRRVSTLRFANELILHQQGMQCPYPSGLDGQKRPRETRAAHVDLHVEGEEFLLVVDFIASMISRDMCRIHSESGVTLSRLAEWCRVGRSSTWRIIHSRRITSLPLLG